MSKGLTLLFLLTFASLRLMSQSLSISGTVKDKKGETLPGAGVYLSGYKLATVTDAKGNYILPGLPAGSYDVLVEMMGYLPYTKHVVIADKPMQVDLVLTENTIQLKEVVIRVDPNRAKYIELFKEFFIGKTPNAKACRLLNPQVLDVDYDNKARTLTVKSNEFLVIENKALGYRLKYMLQFFEYDYKSRIVYYSGLPNFEELKASNGKKKKWDAARDLAYFGSAQHFFKSLFAGTTAQEGFIINKLIQVPNSDRPSDAIIDRQIERLSRTRYAGLREGAPQIDSLSYWRSLKKMPPKLSILNREDVLVDTLVKHRYKELKSLNFQDDLFVIYTKERETNDFTNFSGHAISRPLTIPNYQVSIVHLMNPPAHFYANGGILEPKSFLYEGFWAYEKIADMVPMDYIVKKNK